MAKKQKYYVVWVGKVPGVYLNWKECEAQISAFPGAKYKGFDTLEEAEKAYDSQFSSYISFAGTVEKKILKQPASAIIKDSISVDAACSGNPGIMEYRGVHTATGRQLFHQGPFPRGTNNIGEFLAIVHGLAYLQQHQKFTMPIYTDSATAISWIKAKKARTQLSPDLKSAALFDMISRAEDWLKNHTWKNPIIKWETNSWGEIPADFGRKS
ncbi:MAG: ribonuclease H family protein [Saprospiraceae bacterium]|nr:ribonuclease H family protein [Saprospiraceae bacterium]